MLDYDKAGYCVKCHDTVIEEKVINGILQEVLKTNYDTTQFLLNDNSKMRVVICKPCKAKLTDKDYAYVMNSVIKGWEKEVEGLSHWSSERKKDYMDNYCKKVIITKSEGVSDRQLEKKLKKFKSMKKVKEV